MNNNDINKMIGYILYDMSQYGLLSPKGISIINDSRNTEFDGKQDIINTIKMCLDDINKDGYVI